VFHVNASDQSTNHILYHNYIQKTFKGGGSRWVKKHNVNCSEFNDNQNPSAKKKKHGHEYLNLKLSFFIYYRWYSFYLSDDSDMQNMTSEDLPRKQQVTTM